MRRLSRLVPDDRAHGTIGGQVNALRRGPEEARTTQVYPGITMDPCVRCGKPCLAGTRIDVATVVGAIGSGDSVEDVQEAYDLTRDQVLAAVRYAAHVAAHLPPAVRESPATRCGCLLDENFPIVYWRPTRIHGSGVEPRRPAV